MCIFLCLCLCAFVTHSQSTKERGSMGPFVCVFFVLFVFFVLGWLCVSVCVRVVCVFVFVYCSFFPVFYVMPSSECGANLSKTLPKSGIQIGKSDQRHTSAVAKINIQPFFAFTQTLSLNSFIFSTKQGIFQEPIKSVPFSFSLFL